MNFRGFVLVVFFLSLAVILPYFVGMMSSNAASVFAGFLINPMDANSYLAKMQQGFHGYWMFQLPYTAEQMKGSPLFLFYLFLGHVSRLFSLPLVFVYHLSRWLTGVFLWFSLWRFFGYFMGKGRLSKQSFLLASVGSGMGWAAFFLNVFTTDFWVAEAYPFLSVYTNPHFPLGLAIILWIFILADEKRSLARELILFGLGTILSIVQPFGVVIVVVVLVLVEILHSILTKKFSLLNFPLFMAGGVAWLGYQYWFIQTDPVLRIWNMQNQTPAPPWWDIVISMSPALLLLPGSLLLQHHRENRLQRFQLLMICWVLTALLLLLAPFNLQRRFLTGLYVPIASLAVMGMDSIQQRIRKKNILWVGLFIASILTNLLVILSGFWGIQTRDPLLYIERSDYEMYKWISARTPENALILASPESGLFIPAFTGRRVVYGHPFETVDSEKRKVFVQNYFQGVFTTEEGIRILHELNVDYVFWGMREQVMGSPDYILSLHPVQQINGTILFEVENSSP